MQRWRAAAVSVTLGAAGALMLDGDGPPLVVPAAAASGDPCGAGDRFASAAAGLLADGALPSEAVTGAVAAASAFVAAGGAAAGLAGWRATGPTASGDGDGDGTLSGLAVAERVRATGGTVVATGGCFDIVHAGHVRTLQGARALGDCLVVLLNSDRSVRRLKGRDRPVVTEDDRAAVLQALGCVDAVVIFDEDTPEAALERVRPDVFVKGGDYAVGDLPETEVMARWNGQVVILPYVQGRSTTRILSEVVRRGAD
jgi:rfaE bifunctional protein nucleotidyltransferase chain/domain